MGDITGSDKYECRRVTNSLIRKRVLVKPTACEACGEMTKLDCHHNNYNDPFDVAWLCANCHRIAHRGRKEGPRLAGELMCVKCGHMWKPRTMHPAQCPRCKNPNWDK